MLAKDFKKYLSNIDDNANILVYVSKLNSVRQLLDTDIDKSHSGHIIIDAEYDPATKTIKA